MRQPGRRQDMPRRRAITWGSINKGLRGDLPSPALPGSGPRGCRSALWLCPASQPSRRESGLPGQFVRSSSLSRLADTFMPDGGKEAAQGRKSHLHGPNVSRRDGSRYPVDTEVQIHRLSCRGRSVVPEASARAVHGTGGARVPRTLPSAVCDMLLPASRALRPRPIMHPRDLRFQGRTGRPGSLSPGLSSRQVGGSTARPAHRRC